MVHSLPDSRGWKMSKSAAVANPQVPVGASEARDVPNVLNGKTLAKFVLFAVPPAERVDDGPVMRGLIETEQGKLNVAGWKRVARETGSEYLSLKVGNTKPRDANAADGADEWLVGPFYGRLFKKVSMQRGSKRTRYFGFIEDAVKVGDDETGRGVYRTLWQVQIRARPTVSNDGRTHYIDGMVSSAAARVEPGESMLPF
jgi:hypothetical protein